MKIKNYTLVEKLQKSGFTDKEAKIYVAILELGGAFPSKVAEYTDLNRTTVYHILLNLSIRGLVNEVEKKNKVFYQIEKPEKVVKYSENRIRRAEEELETVKSILPDIEGLFGTLGSRARVTYYEDAEGISSIYADMVSGNKKYEMVAFSHGEAFKKYLPEQELKKFAKGKEKLGITTRCIVPDTQSNREYSATVFVGTEEKVWPVLRYIPTELFPFEAEITLYGENKVTITKLESQKLLGIVIEDKLVHDMMKMIFELLWKSDQVRN